MGEVGWEGVARPGEYMDQLTKGKGSARVRMVME